MKISAIGAFLLFKNVFLIKTSSFSKKLVSSLSSYQFDDLAPYPFLARLVSRAVNWWKNEALISRSGLREFKYSKVLYKVHLYLF